MMFCVDNMGMECVHPSGFAYCEAEAYGLDVTYPEDDLPYSKTHLVNSIDEIDKIKELDIEEHKGMLNRVSAVKRYKELHDEDVFICGHMEGPFAEYSDLRGLGQACMSIGDAASSQIGPDLYREYIFKLHKELVEYVHSLGAYVKIHICVDISPILDMLIDTKANIIDVDTW